MRTTPQLFSNGHVKGAQLWVARVCNRVKYRGPNQIAAFVIHMTTVLDFTCIPLASLHHGS